MITFQAALMVEAIENYIQRQNFPAIDRVEIFFSSISDEDPLIGGQFIEVERQGMKHEVHAEGIFHRLIQYKVTAEKRGAGWNIVCAPGVPNAVYS